MYYSCSYNYFFDFMNLLIPRRKGSLPLVKHWFLKPIFVSPGGSRNYNSIVSITSTQRTSLFHDYSPVIHYHYYHLFLLQVENRAEALCLQALLSTAADALFTPILVPFSLSSVSAVFLHVITHYTLYLLLAPSLTSLYPRCSPPSLRPHYNHK